MFKSNCHPIGNGYGVAKDEGGVRLYDIESPEGNCARLIVRLSDDMAWELLAWFSEMAIPEEMAKCHTLSERRFITLGDDGIMLHVGDPSDPCATPLADLTDQEVHKLIEAYASWAVRPASEHTYVCGAPHRECGDLCVCQDPYAEAEELDRESVLEHPSPELVMEKRILETFEGDPAAIKEALEREAEVRATEKADESPYTPQEEMALLSSIAAWGYVVDCGYVCNQGYAENTGEQPRPMHLTEAGEARQCEVCAKIVSGK